MSRGYVPDNFAEAEKKYRSRQRDIAAEYVSQGVLPEAAMSMAMEDLLALGSLDETVTLDQDDGGVRATVSKSKGWCAIRHDYSEYGICNDCGHTIDVSEEIGGLDIGDHCSECGQEWTGTL